MSKLLRCNRCGQEAELPSQMVERTDSPVVKLASILGNMASIKTWSQLKLSRPGFPIKPPTQEFDLCEDCREVFVEQFMKGAKVEAITQPAGMNQLPHDNVPYQDCLLAFDPDQGRFVCEHDDPERFLWLQRNRAQNVAEGVPELQAQIGQLAEDVITAGVAHAVPQRCSAACSEMHTYREGCLLANVVSDVPGQISPPACGAGCGETSPDGSMTNPHHTYNFGTCLLNRDTAHAIAVVCPVCKTEGSMSGLVKHMDEEHQMVPDYANAQWVGRDGRNLEGRLLSQQGEDLTEAYSPQEPAE